MVKKIMFCAFVISFISCNLNTSTELQTPMGYKYTHINTNGQKVKEGDFVSFNLSTVGSDGVTLEEYSGSNMPVIQISTQNKQTNKNPIMDMLALGGKGDSMTLYMPIDSLQNSNPKLQALEYLKYVISIEKVTDEATFLAEKEEERKKASLEIEATKARLDEVAANTKQILNDYKAGKLDVQTTSEGLKYVIHEPGDGVNAMAGKTALVNYYGAFMDGEMFDASFLKGSPYPVKVGQGSVIKGWDLGLPLMKKGTKASLFIPYALAYGEAGRAPRIPAKSDLMFYMEVVDVN